MFFVVSFQDKYTSMLGDRIVTNYEPIMYTSNSTHNIDQ